MPAPGERALFPNGHLETRCLENAGCCVVQVKFLLSVSAVDPLSERFIPATYLEK